MAATLRVVAKQAGLTNTRRVGKCREGFCSLKVGPTRRHFDPVTKAGLCVLVLLDLTKVLNRQFRSVYTREPTKNMTDEGQSDAN